MKKSIYLIVCLILFFIFHNKPLFAEESMLTLKQQLDRLQREVNDLSRSVFRDSNQSNANSKDNNDSQTEKFAAIDMRIYDLEKVIKKLDKDIAMATGKLSNPKFTDKAPEDVVQKEREKLEQAKRAREKTLLHQVQIEAL